MFGRVLLASTAHATSALNGKGDSFGLGATQVANEGPMTSQPSAASPAGEAPASAGPGQAEDEQAHEQPADDEDGFVLV